MVVLSPSNLVITNDRLPYHQWYPRTVLCLLYMSSTRTNQFPDPDDLRLKPMMTGIPPAKKQRPPRHQGGEKFVKGPIPWNWIQRTTQFKNQALAVGMLIWREAGIENSNSIKLCLGWAEELGINRQAARRGLKALEKAGLMSVVPAKGRCHQITILDAATTIDADSSEFSVEKPNKQR